MIKVEYKDGKADLEIFGEEPVVLAELTHARRKYMIPSRGEKERTLRIGYWKMYFAGHV